MGFFKDLAYNVRGTIAKEMGLSKEPFHRRPYTLIADPKKKLAEVEWMLKSGYLKKLWATSTGDIEKGGLQMLIQECIEDYHGLRNKLGYPYVPLEEIPDEEAYKRWNVEETVQSSDDDYETEPYPDDSSLESEEASLYLEKQQAYHDMLVKQVVWQQEKEAQKLWLASERDRFRYDLECRRLTMEKELKMYEIQLKHTSLSYSQELQILQLQMENQRLRAMISEMETG